MKFVIGVVAVTFICLISSADAKPDPFASSILDTFKKYKQKFDLFVKRVTDRIKESWQSLKNKITETGEKIKKNFHKFKADAKALTKKAMSTIEEHFPKNATELRQLLVKFENKVTDLDKKVKNIIEKVSNKVQKFIFDRTEQHNQVVAELNEKLAPSEKCRTELGSDVNNTFNKLQADMDKCGTQALKPLESIALKVENIFIGMPQGILKVVNDAVTCYNEHKKCLSTIVTVITTIAQSIAAVEALENAEVNLMMTGIMTVGCKFGFSIMEWYKTNNIESKVDKCLRS